MIFYHLRNSLDMRRQIKLVIGLAIEVFLLIFILIVVLVGILGIFFPILPGLVLIGVAVGFYLLLLRNEKNKITRFIHTYVVKLKPILHSLKNNKISMGLIKKIKNKKKEKIKEEILKQGLILFGFNLVLTLALFFALTAVTVLASLFVWQGIIMAFLPLIVIFLFAATCAIIWYRFGQILGQKFKKKKILYAGLVVVISIIPLLLVLLFLAAIMISLKTFSDPLIIAFLGTVFVTILAVVFEVLIVSLGVVTQR